MQQVKAKADVLTQLMDLFGSEGKMNRSIHVSEKLGFIYFVQPVAGCTTIKLNLNSWEAEARGIPYPVTRPEEIHTRRHNPLPMPKRVGYPRFVEMLASKDVIKLTSWRHPRERLIAAYLKKIRRNSGARQKLAEVYPLPNEITFQDFVNVLADPRALHFDHHWRPQVVNAAVDVLDMDRILLLDKLDDELGELSLALTGARKPVRDARELHQKNQSGQEKAPDLEEMKAIYERGASHLYERDRAYYDAVVASRAPRTSEPVARSEAQVA